MRDKKRKWIYLAPEWMQNIVDSISSNIQNLFLTKEGKKFANKRSRYVTKLLKKEGQNSGYVNKNIDKFNNYHVFAINPNALTEESMKKLTSEDLEDSSTRDPYLTFTKIIGLEARNEGFDEKLAWPMRQTRNALHDRKM